MAAEMFQVEFHLKQQQRRGQRSAGTHNYSFQFSSLLKFVLIFGDCVVLNVRLIRTRRESLGASMPSTYNQKPTYVMASERAFV